MLKNQTFIPAKGRPEIQGASGAQKT